MSIPTLFFICLAVAILGFIIAIINIATAIPRVLKSGPTNMFVTHAIAAIFYVLGGIGAIGFGITWIVTYLKH